MWLPHRGCQPHKASLSPEMFPVLHVTPAPGGGSWEPFDVPEPFPFPVRTPRLRARGIKNPLSTRLHPHPHGDLLRLTGPTGRWEGARMSQSSHPTRVGELPPAPLHCRAVPGCSSFFSLTRVGVFPLPLEDNGGSFSRDAVGDHGPIGIHTVPAAGDGRQRGAPGRTGQPREAAPGILVLHEHPRLHRASLSAPQHHCPSLSIPDPPSQHPSHPQHP